MKKFLISALMLLATLSASAQLISAARDNDGVKFGVRGSFALSNLNQTVDEEKGEYFSTSAKQLPAFALGFAMDLPVLESFHFNVELKYAMKGDKKVTEYKYEDDKSERKFIRRIGYVEMPIQPQFRLNFSDAAHLNVNVGPYLGLAVHGHQKYTEDYADDADDYVEKMYLFSGNGYEKKGDGSKERFDGDDDDVYLSRFDVGMAFGLDFVIEHFHIGASYEVGLKDIYKDAKFSEDIPNYKPYKNRTALFTIGIDF